ncbi:MAG: cation diffusion facilitator family transporter [Methanobacteriota archaeon]|nr:MAG: cation diffusion facilitator family transporter [Euryarchaeota archaeon]
MAKESLYAAMFANFMLGVTKLVAGVLSGSAAMIAEAYHSFADTFNQILLWVGIRRSYKKPDRSHPFGYQKVQFFWAFVVAILIFGISGTLAFNEGLHRLQSGDHEPLDSTHLLWNLLVLGIGILLESFSSWTALKEVKAFQKKMKSEDLLDALDEMQDPVLLSVFVEDLLALAGLVIAFVGTLLSFFLHDPFWDGLTSMVIGLLLMVGGLLLARENKRYLIGKSVHPTLFEKIKDAVGEFKGLKEIHDIKTMLLGPNDIILALDLEFNDEIERGDLAEHIDKLEEELISRFGFLKKEKIFIEVQ